VLSRAIHVWVCVYVGMMIIYIHIYIYVCVCIQDMHNTLASKFFAKDLKPKANEYRELQRIITSPEVAMSARAKVGHQLCSVCSVYRHSMIHILTYSLTRTRAKVLLWTYRYAIQQNKRALTKVCVCVCM
jgi:hypothetical protein